MDIADHPTVKREGKVTEAQDKSWDRTVAVNQFLRPLFAVKSLLKAPWLVVL